MLAGTSFCCSSVYQTEMNTSIYRTSAYLYGTEYHSWFRVDDDKRLTRADCLIDIKRILRKNNDTLKRLRAPPTTTTNIYIVPRQFEKSRDDVFP